MISFLFVEILATFQLGLLAFGASNSFLASFLNARTHLFYALGRSSTYLIVLLFVSSYYRLFVSLRARNVEHQASSSDFLKLERLILGGSILISIIAALYPYLPTINPLQLTVSVDTPQYVKFVNEMTSSRSGILSAFGEVNGGDRPIPLVIIYLVHQISRIELVHIINYLPMILGPLLIVAVYFFSRSVFDDWRIRALSTLFAATSHYVVVGIYGGFFANWFALVLMMLVFMFGFKASKTFDYRNLGATSLLLIMILFTHPYTWSPVLISTLIFLLVTVSGNIQRKALMLLRSILIVAVPNLIVENLKTSLFNSVGGLAGDYAIASVGISFQQFLLRFFNLDFTFSTYVGGYLANPFVILLSAVCILIYPQIRFVKMMGAFIVAISIPTLFGDFLIQSRLVYLIPFPILAALALTRLSQISVLKRTLIPLAFFISLNYTLWALINLPL
jgi:hypothetical protein